jgi:hypothetical protein
MKMVRLLFWILTAVSLHGKALAEPKPSDDPHAWALVMDWSRAEHSQALKQMSKIRGPIEVRCRALHLKNCDEVYPPKPYPSGYGLIPDILPDSPKSDRKPYRNNYSLERLTERLSLIVRDIALLESEHFHDAEATGSTAEFIRIRKVLDNLDEHIKYHALWQSTVLKHAQWYAKRRPLAHRARALMKAVESGASQKKIDALGSGIVDALKPFERVAHSISCTRSNGGLVLVMSIETDIENGPIKRAFSEALTTYFSGSTGQGPLRVEARFIERKVQGLYGELVPTIGSRIHEKSHLDKFGTRRLILTTGANSIHAILGRAIFLPSRPVTPRKLAHEAGHLLGFRDVYLRHFTGPKRPRYGAIFHEWAGLENDLMGNSHGGVVSARMRDKLVHAYCGKAR